MSQQRNVCDSYEYPEPPMPRTSSRRDAQSTTGRPSTDNGLPTHSSNNGVHVSKNSTRRNLPSTSNRLPASSSDSDASPEPKRRKIQESSGDEEFDMDKLKVLMKKCEAAPSSESPSGSAKSNANKMARQRKTRASPESGKPGPSSRRDVQSSSRRRRAPTPDYVLPAHYSAKGTHVPRSSTRRRVVPLYRVLTPLSDSSDESPQPIRRKNPKAPKGSTRKSRNDPSPSYCPPSCSESDGSPEPIRRRNQGDHEDRELSREELIRIMDECAAAPSSPSQSDSEESGDDSSGSEFEEPLPRKKKADPKKKIAPKRRRERSPIIVRTERQKAIGRKTLKAIFKETQYPSVEMRAQIAEVLLMNRSSVNRFFRRERKKSDIPDRVKRITPEMRQKLEAEFKTNPHPTTERKLELATEFNVLLERVTTWFIIRRQKEYKPEAFAAAQERRRVYKNERDHQIKIKENRQPAFRFTEEQKEFMNKKMKEVEGKKLDVEQHRVWGEEIGLESYQVGHYIRNHLQRQKNPAYDKKIRMEKKRRVNEGLEEYKKVPRPTGPPHAAEEAIPIIKAFLEANPDYKLKKDDELARKLNWSKSRLMHFVRDKGLVGRRKAQTGNSSGLKSKIEQKPFVSKADAEEWAKQFNLSVNTVLSLSHKYRERVLRKYLSGENTVDSLPPAMRALEEDYSKSVFIKSVADAIEIKTRVGIELISVNGFFSMRRKLDRERGVDILKEDDVPKYLAKDVRRFKQTQKKAKAAVNHDDSSGPNNGDLDKNDEMGETSRPQTPEAEKHQVFEDRGNDNFDEDDEMEETGRPQSSEDVHRYSEVLGNGNFDESDEMEETNRLQSPEEDQGNANDLDIPEFEVPQNFARAERGTPEEDSAEEDDISSIDSEAWIYNSDWEHEDLLAGGHKDYDNYFDEEGPVRANILMEPKEEDRSGADMLREPENERM